MQPPPVQLSEESDCHAMTLSLAEARYLFEAPALDPMAGSHLGQSGVDMVLQRLKRQKLPRETPLALSIRLPTAQAGADSEAQLQAALSAYTAAQIASEEDGLKLLRRETGQSLRVGGLFLAVCLTLSALVDLFTFLPPFAQTLLRESLVIAGWVGLWHPLDLLLYSWWPARFRIGLLNRLKTARVQLQPD